MLEDLVEVLLGSLNGHSLQHSGGVVGVLEVGSQVITAGLHGYVNFSYLCLGQLAL